MTGLISSMQHFSTGDGPGIRTTVFLKGCNLRCEWCHNPETISSKPVFMFYEHLCTNCGLCQEKCPQNAHRIIDNKHFFERKLCILCGTCIEHCQSGALKISGEETTLSAVMDYILEDIDFYSASNGGVTISGGEPLCQAEFTRAIAKECKNHNIHIIIDTAGNVNFSAFEKVIPYTDIFYFDLKGATEQDYRQKTGGSLNTVLKNMTRLAASGCSVVSRIPIIPGYSDSARYCAAMAEMLMKTGVRQVNILPFHRLGTSKYSALEKKYPYAECVPLSREKMEELLDVFLKYGLDVKIDG